MSSAPDPRALESDNQGLHAHVQPVQPDRTAAAETPQRAATDAQSQGRFRTLFEQSPLGQQLLLPDLTIRQANAALVTLLGCRSPAEVEGRCILDFAPPPYRADWHELQQRLWHPPHPRFSFDTCLVRADGSLCWCQVQAILVPDEGEALGYATLIETSAPQQRDASLRRRYDAQQTNLHLVVHDLKAPLGHIQLLTELLRRGAGRPPAETTKFLHLIMHACAQATALLEDVLYLGELDATQLVKTPTDLNAFLAAHLTVHRLAAQEKGLDLVLHVPPHVVTAPLNPHKFSRVLANLLTNALKFTPAGGRVVVRLAEHAGRPRLSVQDTGIGIAPHLQPHLFDKFSTAARAGLHGEASTGLGLFITQQIVRLHGGTIWLSSREGAGTTFFIDL